MVYGDANPGLAEDKGPVGIGGGLLLMLVGLVVVMLMEIWSLTGIQSVFAALRYLNRDQTSLELFYVGGSFLIGLLGPIVVLIQMLRKSRDFPAAFVSLVILWIIFGLIVGIAQQNLFLADSPWGDFSNFWRSFLARVAGLLFIPYIAKARRVKNTFVK